MPARARKSSAPEPGAWSPSRESTLATSSFPASDSAKTASRNSSALRASMTLTVPPSLRRSSQPLSLPAHPVSCGKEYPQDGQHTTRHPVASGQVGRHPCPSASNVPPQSGHFSSRETSAGTGAPRRTGA